MSTTVRMPLLSAGRGPLCATVTETGTSPYGRFVRVLITGARGTVAADEHLRATAGAPLRVRGIADVLVGPERPAECLGAAVVAVPSGDRCLLECGVADGRAVVPVRLGPAHRAQASWETWASVAHAWLVAGLPAAELGSVPGAGAEQPGGRRHAIGDGAYEASSDSRGPSRRSRARAASASSW